MSDTQTTAQGHPGIHRPLALVILLVVGVLSLPISAAFEGEGDNSENWILPVAVLGAALVGAVVGGALPGLAGAHAGRGRAMVTGAAVGVTMLVLGTILFFLVISG